MVSEGLIVREELLLKHFKYIPHEVKAAFRACWFEALIRIKCRSSKEFAVSFEAIQ